MLHKFGGIALAGDVKPGRPQRGQLQQGLQQLCTSLCEAANLATGSFSLDQFLPVQIDKAKNAHPPKKQRPPIGVTAPKARIPLRQRAYRLPENSTIPAKNNHPAI